MHMFMLGFSGVLMVGALALLVVNLFTVRRPVLALTQVVLIGVNAINFAFWWAR